MPLPGTHGEIYRFGAFELASGPGELRKHGARLKLQDQPVRLLILLLENAGEVVTREQIQKRLWADDVYVDYENAINSAVRKLREVLIDTSDNPRFVETLARRGYRFIAPVSRIPPVAAVTPAEILPIIAPINMGEPAFGPPEASPQTAPRTAARKLHWLLSAGALVAIAALGGAAFWFERGRGSSEPPLHAVPLTSHPGYEVDPSFSPDGNQVAFAWNGDKDGKYNLYVQLIGSGRPLRLTNGLADDSFPAWSPDGRSIAFKRLESNGNNRILLIPALGGAEREIAQLGNSSSSIVLGWTSIVGGWSTDGRRLLISWADNADEPAGLYWVSADTGEKQRLTSPPTHGALGDHWCSISPDGKTIAFVRSQGIGVAGQAGTPGELYTLSLTSGLAPKGEPKRLTFDNTGIGQVAWVANSREIVFASSRSGSPALWRIAASGSEKPRRLEVGEGASFPAISPRSNRLVYSQTVFSDYDIWRMDLSNPALPPASFIASTRPDMNPQYSPDGKRIVFRSARSGSLEIWACDADGSNPVRLTTRGGAGSPRWSPDSRLIAFDSQVDGHWEVFVMAANGGQQRQLTHGVLDARPNWSRDGKWLYFTSTRSGREEVWKMPVGGGAATQVTRNGGTNAAESEDGLAIYYESHGTIRKAGLDGSGEIRIVDALAINQPQNFALTEAGIFYRSRETDGGVWFLSFADGKSRRILKADKPLWAGLSVSPDGHWLLYTQQDGQPGSDLMLVENFH